MRGWIPDSLAPLGFGDDAGWERQPPPQNIILASRLRRAKVKAGIQVTAQHG